MPKRGSWFDLAVAAPFPGRLREGGHVFGGRLLKLLQDPLPARAAEYFGVGPAVVVGEELAEVAAAIWRRPTGRWVTVTGSGGKWIAPGVLTWAEWLIEATSARADEALELIES